MNKTIKTGLAISLIVGLSGSLIADEAREFMEKVDENARLTTDSAFSRMQLATCKFGIADNKIKCVEKPRIKLLETAQLNTGIDGQDTKSIAIVLEPSSERGIGMLSYVYDDVSRDNETWLYLSALGKVKRIASGNSDDESESASLFGSEITTEDQETGKLDDYRFKILNKGDYRNRPVFILESVPNEKRAAKSRYAKTISWIDTERLVTLKTQMYDKNGKAIKRIQTSSIEQINGIWMVRKMTVMNLVTNRLTNLEFKAITFGVEIDENFLSQRSLTDAAYREKHLSALRAQTQ